MAEASGHIPLARLISARVMSYCFQRPVFTTLLIDYECKTSNLHIALVQGFALWRYAYAATSDHTHPISTTYFLVIDRGQRSPKQSRSMFLRGSRRGSSTELQRIKGRLLNFLRVYSTTFKHSRIRALRLGANTGGCGPKQLFCELSKSVFRLVS